MNKLIIFFLLILGGCDTTNIYGDCDSGGCDAGECPDYDASEPKLCCYYYPSGIDDEVCGLVEGLNDAECDDLADEMYEEFPSQDGAVHSSSVPLLECWMYEPEWCIP